jgi:hypothetical protein
MYDDDDDDDDNLSALICDRFWKWTDFQRRLPPEHESGIYFIYFMTYWPVLLLLCVSIAPNAQNLQAQAETCVYRLNSRCNDDDDDEDDDDNLSALICGRFWKWTDFQRRLPPEHESGIYFIYFTHFMLRWFVMYWIWLWYSVKASV